MKVMLLAAGRGERMGRFSAERPKPLLSLGPETLIERHLRRLAAAGFDDVVINLSYRGAQIRAAVGEATRWGQTVSYSEEGEPPLETAGGIVHALPLLGDEPFAVVSADVVTDFDFALLLRFGAAPESAPQPGQGDAPAPQPVHGDPPAPQRRAATESGCLVLVPNPPHHPGGDFGLTPRGVLDNAPPRYTFSGIAALRPAFFHGLAPGVRPLRTVLRPAVRRAALLGMVFEGLWHDVGTPQRLADVRQLLRARRSRTARGSTG